jgi:proline iminopeptidase
VRRFFHGDYTPEEFIPLFMQFGKAYFYRFNLKANMSEGDAIVFRPEAHIFAGSQLLNGWTVMDRLWEIDIPALVMAGRQDFLFPPECMAILADRLPDARLEIIERAGHNPQLERTGEVLRVIEEFMA